MLCFLGSQVNSWDTLLFTPVSITCLQSVQLTLVFRFILIFTQSSTIPVSCHVKPAQTELHYFLNFIFKCHHVLHWRHIVLLLPPKDMRSNVSQTSERCLYGGCASYSALFTAPLKHGGLISSVFCHFSLMIHFIHSKATEQLWNTSRHISSVAWKTVAMVTWGQAYVFNSDYYCWWLSWWWWFIINHSSNREPTMSLLRMVTS